MVHSYVTVFCHKYMKSAVHHKWRTALFSVNRAGFNIYSLPPCFP